MIEERITALLSGVADGKRYWVKAPRRDDGSLAVTPPYLVLHRVDGLPNYHFCGRGTVESRVQVNCIAETYGAVKALARAVVATLDMFSDPAAGIYGVFVDGEGRDLAEDAPGGVNTSDAGSKLFGVAVDFRIHHAG
ncbi:MAG: DUF3168 domain-containing protein [Pseudomonadota bacterium]|nr:DUF3168 domain-containing protein [Pseudomonadota bacterium]